MIIRMRTTIDLPEDLHQIAASIARDRSQTLSEAVADLVRRGLGRSERPEIRIDERTGFPVVRLGTTISTESVRSLDDAE